MNNMRNKILMTLALLLTAVTGAWAEEATITLSCGTTEKTFEKAELPWSSTADILKEVISDFKQGPGIQSITGGDGKVVKNGNENFQVTGTFSGKATVEVSYVSTSFTTTTATITVTAPAPEPAIVFKWDAETKTGTFTMPAFDVEIAPIYAPVAQWAKVEDVDQLPTAAEGIFAESTDSIITPGKVAKIGETEDLQGEVMYFATGDKNMTAEEAAKAEGWLSKLPTAAGYERDTTIYVWYYIKGADTPQGQTATAENTFNDSEICPEPIEVKILSNKFDIQFKAANANTIEAGKATVTANGEQKTVNEGKLEGVKMGTEVKVKAKDGYKFRKVEAKKGGLLSITIGGATTATIYYVEGETWAQAIQNHPTENSAWSFDQDGSITGNGNYLFAGDDFVYKSHTINPNAGYIFQWT